MRGKSLFDNLMGYQAPPTPEPTPEPQGYTSVVEVAAMLFKISATPVDRNPHVSERYSQIMDKSYGAGKWRYEQIQIVMQDVDKSIHRLDGYWLNIQPQNQLYSAYWPLLHTVQCARDATFAYKDLCQKFGWKDEVHHRLWYNFAHDCRRFWNWFEETGGDLPKLYQAITKAYDEASRRG